MQDVNILHGVKTIMTNQTGLHVRLQKRDRLSIEYNIPMLCGEIRCVGALSPAQALRSWPSSKLPLFCFLMLVYQREIYISTKNI